MPTAKRIVNADMSSPCFVKYIVVLTAVVTAFIGGNNGEDVCSSSGEFCGGAQCSPANDNETFFCDCGPNHYFNATSKRCLHLFSCQVIPCQHSICVDDDGHSEAKCTCEGLPHMTADCEVDPAFRKQCDAKGGRVKIASEDGRSVLQCECPAGTKQLPDGMCKSIACLFPNLTCEEICSNGKLREDQRCCQNWNEGRCNERPQPGTFCEPGTVWIEADKSCMNACAASESGPVCERGCTYADPAAPAYQCKCQDDEVLSPDGLDCKVRTECSDHDIQICATEGRLCSVDSGHVRCKCPDNTIEDAHNCSDTCSSEKAHECASFLGSCMVNHNAETCICQPPLRWDSESKQCVLDKQFKFVVFFKIRDLQGPFTAQEQCSDRTQGEIINVAMKNLYGLQLQEAQIVNCSSKMTKIELTFNEDPPKAVLQRIHLCESGSQTCHFPPSLDVEKGSVSGPVDIDLCHTYFEKLPPVANGTYRCSNLSHGRYLIHCANGKNKNEIQSGFLGLHLCADGDEEKKQRNATWDYRATITSIIIAVLGTVCLVLGLLLWCRRRFCFYSIPVDDTAYGPVKFQGKENLAEEPELTLELLPPRYTLDTPRMQNRANEATVVRT